MDSRTYNKKILCILGLAICLCSGCSSSEKNTSDLLIIGDESAESAEEIQEVETTEIEEAEPSEEIESATEMISVYICGAVMEAGVYEVDSGSRVYHVIDLAGGMTEEAMKTYLNLAQELTDGQMIYVPTVEEVEDGSVESVALEAYTNGTSNTSSDTSGKININTASLEELCNLTGIGEAKAASIISYREENNGFDSIEELLNVSGIKEGTYSQLEDEVTVG